MINSEIGSILVEVAKSAIKEVFIQKRFIDRKVIVEKYPELNEFGASFVTLTENRALRGCIGSLEGYRPLIDDVIENARSSAFHDPRFERLSESEFELIEIEVSILSQPKRVDYRDIDNLKEIIEIGKDGVILQLGLNRATFLPQVWEELPTFNEFFNHLCLKAGLNIDCLKNRPEVSIYRVEKFKS